MITDIPSGYEAHRLISISLGKIASSRSGRTGASLHKSLLVASVLHKARFVYFEETHHYQTALFCPQVAHHPLPQDYGLDRQSPSPPLPEVTVTPVMAGDRHCRGSSSSRLTAGGESDDSVASVVLTTTTRRKRRRVTSDQEIEAAVSSILPKRLKSTCDESDDEEEDEDDRDLRLPSCPVDIIAFRRRDEEESRGRIFFASSASDLLCSSCGYKNASCQCSDASSSSSSSGEEEDECSMEVDHITSLVSIFSFNPSPPLAPASPTPPPPSDLCSAQVHHQSGEAVGPPVLALTA